MDPNAQTTPTPAAPNPMREPHIPISEREMQAEPQHLSARTTLLTLASILLLAGVVGLTLWFFIQNRQDGNMASESTTQNSTNIANSGIQPSFTPVPANDCKSAGSMELALQNPESICYLTLPEEKLTELPDEVLQLKNLKRINLSRNSLTTFPVELLTLPLLEEINLDNNGITTLPNSIYDSKTLLKLSVVNNPIENKPTKPFGSSSSLSITY